MINHPFSLAGETALITGGGSGIGYGIAQCFVQSGARVLLIGRRESVLQDAVNQLGENADYLVFDITNYDEMADFVRAAYDKVGHISILINNAGNHLKQPMEDTSIEEFQKVIDTHLLGAFALTQQLVPAMRERKRGSILFMASMTSFVGMTQVIAYSAVKSAYLGVIRTLVTELSHDNIRVNGIAPGWIESPMMLNAINKDEARKNKIVSRIAMDHFGQPEDIGWAAVYLCSEAAKYVTGVVLPVDGGALANI